MRANGQSPLSSFSSGRRIIPDRCKFHRHRTLIAKAQRVRNGSCDLRCPESRHRGRRPERPLRAVPIAHVGTSPGAASFAERRPLSADQSLTLFRVNNRCTGGGSSQTMKLPWLRNTCPKCWFDCGDLGKAPPLSASLCGESADQEQYADHCAHRLHRYSRRSIRWREDPNPPAKTSSDGRNEKSCKRFDGRDRHRVGAGAWPPHLQREHHSRG